MADFVSVEKAADQISSGMHVGICGFGGWLGADLIFEGLAKRFEETGSPHALEVFSGIMPGDLSDAPRGMNLLAKEGLIAEVRAAHVGMAPRFGRMIAENRLRAFALPLGIVSNLLHAAAAKKPGVVSRVGIGTFCDPRVEGGALNDAALMSKQKVAELVSLDGEETLLYKSPKLDACILRVSTADERGNLSSINDPLTAEQLEMALATRANGGIVIAQADTLASKPLAAKEILLHNSIVDYIVVDTRHRCSPGYDCAVFRPELCGQTQTPVSDLPKMALDQRKICGRRGARELKEGSIVNLGIGIPEAVAAVAAEEGLFSRILLSVESGPLGGVPVGGVGFGASVNPQVIFRLGDNFDFYDGGGLHIAFLGAGEIDEAGNVNVSRFGARTTGPGGFINIVQSTPTVCFMSTFTASGLKTAVEGGRLAILQEGRTRKFCKQVQQITFSADYARKNGQRILYITERAVFALGERGLVLTEIAPGVDLERDILSQMDFLPEIAPDLKAMDAEIFLP